MRKFNEFFNKEHIQRLGNQLLFSGLTEHEIFMFLQFSSPNYEFLERGESISITDKMSHTIGVVFSGAAYVYSVDSDGNRQLLETVSSGTDSGMLYSMFGYQNSVIELTAREESEVLLIKPESLFITEESLAVIQQKILVNMLASQRQIFLDLSEHISCLSQRSIKSKVLKLLRVLCDREGKDTVEIPFSREELANYLSVDRSALSRALGELKNDGVIDFKKNRFTLLNTRGYRYE